jgi:uncharacterized protein (DUF1684 family)
MMYSFKIAKFWLLVLVFFVCAKVHGQENYKSTLTIFRKNYIQTHDVVKGDSTKFLKFFAIHEKYAVKAEFVKLDKPVEFKIPTSSGKAKEAIKIGALTFNLKGKGYSLSVYQLKSLLTTEKYHDYVFVPFTDLTSGIKSYGGGRYLDFNLSEIIKSNFIIDFNKTYNPSCIYAEGFNCPIPPRENDLAVKIKSGEKIYSLYYKKHIE